MLTQSDPTARPWLRRALLLVALIIVFLVAFHPHWNVLTGARNEYPVHLDEYVHWGFAKQAIAQGTVTFGDPFVGNAASNFDPALQVHERGYQAYLGAFQAVTGISWVDIFEYGPALIAVFLALCLYALMEQWGAGVEAALWVAAIPTTLRFLGPGFLVPIALALVLVAVGLCILAHASGWRGIAALTIVSAAIWPIHLMGGLALFVISLAFGIARVLRGRAGLYLIIFTAIPALAALPYFNSSFGETPFIYNALPPAPDILQKFGLVPLLAAGVGAVFLLAAPPSRRRDIGWAVTIGLVAAEVVFFVGNAFGLDVFKAYDRSLLMLCLFACVLAGVTLATLRSAILRWPTFRKPVWALSFAVLLFAAQAGAVMMSADQQMRQVYYEALTANQFNAYTQASDVLGQRNGTAVVDGINTMAFTDITGHTTSFQLPPGSTSQPPDARDFFAGKSADTAYLIAHHISIVVTDLPVENPDLREIAPGVYLLSSEYVTRQNAPHTP